MKRTIIIIISILMLFLGRSEAFAQRTAYGEQLLSADIVFSQFSLRSIGISASYGQYLLSGYWMGGANYVSRIEIDAPSSEIVTYTRLQGFGGYMYRLYGSRDRRLNAYGGGDLFIGAEFFDPAKSLTSHTRQAMYEAGIPDAKFIFGLSPRLEAEFFLSSNIAITATFRLPICFLSSYDVLGCELSIGGRFNF